MRVLPDSPQTRTARPVSFAQWASGQLDQPSPGAWPELVRRWLAFQRGLPELLEQALKQLLSEELALKPEHIRRVAERLLARRRMGPGPLELQVHPDDAPRLAGLSGISGVTLRVNPAVSVGGCVLSSPEGQLDAKLETRLARVVGALGARELPAMGCESGTQDTAAR